MCCLDSTKSAAEPTHQDAHRVLVCGAGNFLLSDEGFGVHCIRFLEERYDFPKEVELLDVGTCGVFVTHSIEDADSVYLIDCLDLSGEPPGSIHRFMKNDLLLKRLPLKLSPHQIGFQEMLSLSELRGRCPREVVLLGVVPKSVTPGIELSDELRPKLGEVATMLVDELRVAGLEVRESCSR